MPDTLKSLITQLMKDVRTAQDSLDQVASRLDEVNDFCIGCGFTLGSIQMKTRPSKKKS